MKRFITLLSAILMLSVATFAQEQHAHWKTRVIDLGEGLYSVSAIAQIDSSWHIYDTLRTDFGPNATIVNFDVLEGKAEKVGVMTIDAPAYHKYYDEIFMMEIGVYDDSVVFSQQFRLLDESAKIHVFAEWMACDDNNCLPLADVEFSVNIPELDEVEEVGAFTANSGGLLAMIIQAIIWGFVALFTPCIFPMVPMTVSFFMKGSENRAAGRFKAIMYGVFIIVLYTVPIAALIFITRIFGGDAVTADIFNWLATNWLPNVIFFIVFMVFAASFFGLFEITMPGSLTTATDSKANSKGLGGVFFMALTLVLVSFSCTGPIVGNVVILSLSGQFWTPIITMLAFSTAFALPFALLALFPSWLSKLPKSGGWLATVKVVLGFVEVALAFKFLSMADQAYHWGILPRDLYLVIWIVDAFLLLLFMLGAITFPGVDKVRKWGAVRIIFTGIVAAFLVYLCTGLFGAPLKALSGYLPPMETKGWFYDNRTYQEMEDYDPAKVKYGDKLHLAHDLNGFFDLEQARDYAHHVGKPLFIDFTGHACVNCREMEQRVWSDPTVQQILRDEYVIVALYCDDKMTIAEEDWIVVGDKTLKTLGKVNSHIAFSVYGVNAQPCYILESPDGKILAGPRGYDLDVDAYIAFLREGLENYKK